MYLFQKIEEQSFTYTDARRNIGEFLLDQRARAARYSMGDIAERTYVSKATLTRFAQGLGYRGWTPFIRDFVEEARYLESHQADIDPNTPFGRDDSVGGIVSELSALKLEALADTAALIDESAIEAAASLVMGARQVVLFGNSPNRFVAELFRRKMMTIGKVCMVGHNDDSGLASRALTADDCAIIISYSGNNPARRPLSYVEPLKEHGVPLIGITSYGDNYLRREADVVLTISSHERLYSKIATFATEESMNFILDVLFSCCFKLDYEANFQYKIDTSRRLEAKRVATLEDIREQG